MCYIWCPLRLAQIEHVWLRLGLDSPPPLPVFPSLDNGLSFAIVALALMA